MPIDIRAPGDPQSCHDCAKALDTLSDGTHTHAKGFVTASGLSDTEWGGTAGDEFRNRIAAMRGGVDDIAGQAEAAATALRAFADDLATAKAKMSSAADIAEKAGLPVAPGVMIGDPIQLDPNSYDVAPQVRRALQVAAYEAALALAAEGRTIEQAAHAALEKSAQAVKGASEVVKNGWFWMGLGAVQGHVGTAVSQAKVWEAVRNGHMDDLVDLRAAATHAASLGDPYPEAVAARAVREAGNAVDEAGRIAAGNAKLVGGMTDNAFSRLMTATLTEGGEGASRLSKIGSKVPYVGLALTGIQTGFDVGNAEDSGDAAEAVAKNVGGFIAGTVATELLLASAVGGPATFAAVGAGVAVAWGVGYTIDHRGDIVGSALDAAGWLGELF